MVRVQAGGVRLEGSKDAGEVPEGSPESRIGVQVPEGVVRHRFRRAWEDQKSSIRRICYVRFALFEDVQPGAGDYRVIFRESKFYGVVKAGIGIKSMFRDLSWRWRFR